MLKPFTKKSNKNYVHEYLVKSNSLIWSGVVLACLGYLWFILPRYFLFQLVAVGSGLFHILHKKVKTRKALEKVNSRKACKKMKACKTHKKMKACEKCMHVSHVKK